MVFCRPEPSCIDGRACALKGSISYDNDLVLFTSWAASRMAAPDNASQEVSILAAKTTLRPGAILRIQQGWSWVFKNALICWKWKQLCLNMPLPPPWLWLVDGKKSMFSQRDAQDRPHRYSPCKRGFQATSRSIKTKETGSVNGTAQTQHNELTLEPQYASTYS